MKKIFVVLAIAASMISAATVNAQVKSATAARSAVEAAQKASADAKKAVKAATWVKLGQTLIDAYDSPMGNGWVGATEQDLAFVMGSTKPSAEEQVTVNGAPMVKKVYDTMNYYFNQNGQLSIIEVTKPVVENALEKAADAFVKAAELDVKGQKTKEIVDGINGIVEKFNSAAYNEYSAGRLANASEFFAKAYKASSSVAGAKVDLDALYNAGYTSYASGKLQEARDYLKECVAKGYEGENGDAYSKLADVEDKLGNKEEGRRVLENAFTKFPQSQSILIGLINSYMSAGDNTDRLFDLISNAKKNEPENASLYYVEGQIYEKLGNFESASKAYDETIAVNPNFAHGYIGKGILFYNKAVEIQEAASNEMDDNKYNKLVEEFEATLKGCVAPFEKAFETVTEADQKKGIAEYLKNACFRFRTESPEWQAKYEKYAEAAAQ